MGILADIKLGIVLTKFTNFFEEMERTRATAFIGAGGGIDSLPLARQQEVMRNMDGWIATLRKHPRHVITREMMKNMIVSKNAGRDVRMNAQARLLDKLVEMDIALGHEEFEKSYLN